MGQYYGIKSKKFVFAIGSKKRAVQGQPFCLSIPTRVLGQWLREVILDLCQRNWPNKFVVGIRERVTQRNSLALSIEFDARDRSGCCFSGNTCHAAFTRKSMNIRPSLSFSQKFNPSFIKYRSN